MIEDVIKSIKSADLVLVGIGEELDVIGSIEKDPSYQRVAEKANEKESIWMLPYVKKMMLRDREAKLKEIYDSLAVCLKQKNYFMVSLSKDGLVGQSGLDKERIVEPCGGYDKLQCSKKCNTELYPIPDDLLEHIKRFMDNEGEDGEIKEPICPKCGEALVFNNVDADEYMEEGYLDKWINYKKWLQGTINKRLCVLELGVGMKYPTVIRWPFEKIVFFNQKSEMFRVHDRLYQVAEEIGDRAHGICQKPEEFLIELSRSF